MTAILFFMWNPSVEIQSIHTADEVYETRERLYVLEKLLPGFLYTDIPDPSY